MSLYYVVYHGLILLSIILSFVAFTKVHKRYFPLWCVLTLTELVEWFAHSASSKGHSFVGAYHVFVIFEYTLFCFYATWILPNAKINKYIVRSIIPFSIYSIFISWWNYNFRGLPAVNINSEALLLFLIFVYALFHLEPTISDNFITTPETWIVSGILIFFGGAFFFNGLYAPIMEFDKNQGLILFGIINKPLNIILYTFINIGFICLLVKKYFIP